MKVQEEVRYVDVPTVGNRDPQPRGLFAGLPIIILATTVLILAAFGFFNRRFLDNVNACRAMYRELEDVQVISEEEAAFLQVNGQLSSEFTSGETPAALESRFRQANAAAIREAMTSGNLRTQGAAMRGSWTVSTQEDGGTLVTMICP